MKFKNSKLRTLLLSAALLGVGGITGTAQAVVLNNIDRLGDAGLFQYYTVNNGWQTFFRVINTSDEAVSIKVRFREAANSREVLDFTVFLSPHDMWSAWTSADVFGKGDSTPGIRTKDNSCLLNAPNNNLVGEGFHSVDGVADTLGAAFQSRTFTGIYDDGSTATTESRLKEGHMEVIGIARHGRTTQFANAVLHNQEGKPANCAAARNLFKEASRDRDKGGRGWNLRNVLGFNGYLIQVNKGQGGGYDPDVLSFFANRSLTRKVNDTDVEVNLDSGSNFLFGSGQGGTAYNNTITRTGNTVIRQKQQGLLMNPAAPTNGGPQNVTGSVDSVSAWFMRNTVSNEWAAANDSGSVISGKSTQWVLTFPTKNYYVDLQDDALLTDDISPTLVDPSRFNDAYAPFSEEFQIRGESCEAFTMQLWDREEGSASFSSPENSEAPELCYETNVLSFGSDANSLGLDSNFSEFVPESLFPVNGTKGWARIAWTGTGATQPGFGLNISGPLGRVTLATLYGLPVTGWLFTVYNTNDSANNHAAINAHKYTRAFTLFDSGRVITTVGEDDDETVEGAGFFGQTNILGIAQEEVAPKEEVAPN